MSTAGQQLVDRRSTRYAASRPGRARLHPSGERRVPPPPARAGRAPVHRARVRRDLHGADRPGGGDIESPALPLLPEQARRLRSATLGRGAEEIRARIEPRPLDPPPEEAAHDLASTPTSRGSKSTPTATRSSSRARRPIPTCGRSSTPVREATAQRILEGLGAGTPAAGAAVRGWLWFVDGVCLEWVTRGGMERNPRSAHVGAGTLFGSRRWPRVSRPSSAKDCSRCKRLRDSARVGPDPQRSAGGQQWPKPGPRSARTPATAYLEAYGRMLLIRLFEHAMHRLFLEGEVHGTTHLAAGQEACRSGSASRSPRRLRRRHLSRPRARARQGLPSPTRCSPRCSAVPPACAAAGPAR